MTTTLALINSMLLASRNNAQRAGLKYQDLLVEYPAVLQALESAAPATLAARNRRIVRASDVIVKQKPLPQFGRHSVRQALVAAAAAAAAAAAGLA
ncbi:hypothetical protein JKP88DRAFT_349627 [Tribonema minus]|uniref:Uncharacterized protein n=1 Tax=Tribonema minus TaxID=303371 RepID=A0A836CDT6_9STRA|nr:hypothetical protein JKP88DRAFT_349627 [Tribonema minus]